MITESEAREMEAGPGDAFQMQPIDIARCCAVLVARGIERGDL